MSAVRDLQQATEEIEKLTCTLGNLGFYYMDSDSDRALYERKIACVTCVEMYFQRAKKILCANREFLEEVAKLFMEQRLVKRSDIAKIRAKCNIIPFTF